MHAYKEKTRVRRNACKEKRVRGETRVRRNACAEKRVRGEKSTLYFKTFLKVEQLW
jgi:hypothetical protein